MTLQELNRQLAQYSHVYLYGAGVVAYGAYRAIQQLFNINIDGFLVTDREGQLDEIDTRPVSLLKDLRSSSECFVLITAPEEYHSSMEKALAGLGFSHYLKLDSHMEYVLMGAYLKKTISVKLIEDFQVSGEKIPEECVRVYMAVSHQDKRLEEDYPERPWVKKIQAGAALTGRRIANLTDEGNDTMSGENALYGELTASYYAWKYNKYEVTGLFHYRRVLHVTEEQMNLFQRGMIDVILPLPFVCYPDASGQYGRYLQQTDIEIMLDTVRTFEKDNFKELESLLKRPYLYNYNILIAKKQVFDDYCAWIFPILREITARCEKEKRHRVPRYIGRAGEVLTSLYFMWNKRDWKIVHGEKRWRI